MTKQGMFFPCVAKELTHLSRNAVMDTSMHGPHNTHCVISFFGPKSRSTSETLLILSISQEGSSVHHHSAIAESGLGSSVVTAQLEKYCCVGETNQAPSSP